MAVAKGGKREGAGRKKGVARLSTERQRWRLAEMAKEHSPAALRVLVELVMDVGVSPDSRIKAANSILDRGYGKAVQGVAITGLEDGPVLITIGGEDQKRF